MLNNLFKIDHKNVSESLQTVVSLSDPTWPTFNHKSFCNLIGNIKLMATLASSAAFGLCEQNWRSSFMKRHQIFRLALGTDWYMCHGLVGASLYMKAVSLVKISLKTYVMYKPGGKEHIRWWNVLAFNAFHSIVLKPVSLCSIIQNNKNSAQFGPGGIPEVFAECIGQAFLS